MLNRIQLLTGKTDGWKSMFFRPSVFKLIKGDIEGYPMVGRLFPDYRAAERAYFARTGIFPIMHAVAIKKFLSKLMVS